MKPRIEKKLSKKLASILKDQQGFKPSEVWANNEYADEKFKIHWEHDNPNGLTTKQRRQNFERLGVEVDNMPSLGGDVDYWGEGTDYESVFMRAQDAVCWWSFPLEELSKRGGGYPIVNIRLTGQAVIRLCREYVSK